MEILVAALIIIATTAAAMGGLVLVRKKVSFETLSEHHEVANPMVTTVSTLYSVMLGFFVVCAFNRFDECRSGIQAEANSIRDTYILASGLPGASGREVQTDCLKYVKSVIEDEFPAMRNVQHSPATEKLGDQLWKDALSFTPEKPAEINIHEELLSSVKNVGDRRHDRLFQLSAGLWPTLWGVLIAGNAIVVVFTYFFAMKRIAPQMIMVGLLSLMLSINVYLVIDFSCPFDGVWSVSAEPLGRVRTHMEKDASLHAFTNSKP